MNSSNIKQKKGASSAPFFCFILLEFAANCKQVKLAAIYIYNKFTAKVFVRLYLCYYFRDMKTIQLLLSISCMLLPSLTLAQQYNLLIGTYTNTNASKGIYVYKFDERTGKASYKNELAGVNDPSYLCVAPNGKSVYAVNEGIAKVSAFSFNSQTGELKLINQRSSEGDAPCYVAIDKSGKYIFVANYTGGSAVVLPVDGKGALGVATQVIQHIGKGPDTERQEKPHVHSTFLSPDEQNVLVSDLGTDQIAVYKLDINNKEQPLDTNSASVINTPAGSGPRHVAFGQGGKFIYSLQELNGNISVIKKEGNDYSILQNISMHAPDFNGKTGAADIHLSPDGKFLYSSNRVDANDIAVFSVNPITGLLIHKENFSVKGKGPRNFIITPNGNFLLLANQYTNEVVIFKRNKETGMLKDTGERIKVGSPVCLKLQAL